MFCLQPILLNEMCPWLFTPVVNWVKSCGQFSVEFEEGSEATLVLVWTWDRDTFRRVWVVVQNKYYGETSRNAAVIGQLPSVVDPSGSPVALIWGIICASWHVRRVCWEWVPGEVGRVPHLRHAATREMPSEVCLSRPGQSGSVFDDGVHHCQTKGRWAQGLDAISPCSETCFCVRGSLYAFSGGSLLGALWMSGHWLCASWKIQDARPTETVSGYIILHGFVFVSSSVTYGFLSFSKKKSMDTCILIKWREWSSDCSIWMSKPVSNPTRFFVVVASWERIYSRYWPGIFRRILVPFQACSIFASIMPWFQY